ncbi:MAG: PHP domain-containing protein [Actinobacteria bacterium]|nr:PHP domain-containing protein [Actinomycetota bacterium]
MIDLHTHTAASDGTYSPAELMHLAAESGLEAIAVTDHDTISGLAEAEQAAASIDVELVPGVEFSCKVEVGTLHLLGYFIDCADPGLRELLDGMVASRAQRNPRIISKLNELGYEITLDDARVHASSQLISRLHIALAMVQKKYVRSIEEAFGRFLGDDGSAHADRGEPMPQQAIDIIHGAGGLAVAAHPVHFRASNEGQLTARLRELADFGLDGVEVWYPEHSVDLTDQLWRFCRKADLAAVGGSDFHGSAKPHIKLGVGRGGLNIPLEILHRLKSRLDRC